MKTELTLHDVSTVELCYERLKPNWVGVELDLGQATLTLYFDTTPSGLAAWQQLRQGLRRADDYGLAIDGQRIIDQHERHITEWLFAKQGQAAAIRAVSTS